METTTEDLADRSEHRVEAHESGTRLDAFLAARDPSHSRSRHKALILAGAVTVDGTRERDPSRKLRPNETVALDEPEPEDATPTPEDIALDVVHEDDDLIVVNKPAGLVVHPGAGNPSGTLVNALLHRCGESLSGIGGVRRPGIVHRLDKDTSGLLVAAKTDRAHRGLAEQFADHGRSGDLERSYDALVWGVPKKPSGVVDAPLARDPRNALRRAVVTRGKRAVTHWRLEEALGTRASHISCRLETGRTHQIRVHMAHLGLPLIGDRIYGSGYMTKIESLPLERAETLRRLGRQALHAGLLGFTHPASGERMRFEASIPADMVAVMAALRDT